MEKVIPYHNICTEKSRSVCRNFITAFSVSFTMLNNMSTNCGRFVFGKDQRQNCMFVSLLLICFPQCLQGKVRWKLTIFPYFDFQDAAIANFFIIIRHLYSLVEGASFSYAGLLKGWKLLASDFFLCALKKTFAMFKYLQLIFQTVLLRIHHPLGKSQNSVLSKVIAFNFQLTFSKSFSFL